MYTHVSYSDIEEIQVKLHISLKWFPHLLGWRDHSLRKALTCLVAQNLLQNGKVTCFLPFHLDTAQVLGIPLHKVMTDPHSHMTPCMSVLAFHLMSAWPIWDTSSVPKTFYHIAFTSFLGAPTAITSYHLCSCFVLFHFEIIFHSLM